LKKKPSKKDIENVISNMIVHLQELDQKVHHLDVMFGAYVRYKEDQEGFQEYVKKQFEEKKGNEGSN
jgi:hypothetical protein